MNPELLKLNRLPRKQKGQRIETRTAFFLRYYVSTHNGDRKQECVKLAEKSDMYRSWNDVEPLIARELERVNASVDLPTARMSITDFFEKHYLPWCKTTKAAATVECYRQNWVSKLKSRVGNTALANLTTAEVTALLTHFAKVGLQTQSLSRIKFTLSGAYQYAVALGLIRDGMNPVRGAKWLVKVARPKQQTVYTLEQVLRFIAVLEPLDLRAAVAVALAYFAALRPAEIRGLQWADFSGEELHIRRAMWRNVIGETKTEDSVASVPVIEPLKSLLEKLRAQSAAGFILQNDAGKPLSLDSLNCRLIKPTLKAEWRGYYPCRRGISSNVTDTSKNALNSTGLLRHSTPITALKHYTRAQKESVEAAMKQIEQKALDLMAKGTVQ
jgi:integrase